MNHLYQINPINIVHSRIIYDALVTLGYKISTRSPADKFDWLNLQPNYLINRKTKCVTGDFLNTSGHGLLPDYQSATLDQFLALETVSLPKVGECFKWPGGRHIYKRIKDDDGRKVYPEHKYPEHKGPYFFVVCVSDNNDGKVYVIVRDNIVYKLLPPYPTHET